MRPPTSRNERRPDPGEAAEIAGFVRGTLGCGCPQEVLRDLRIQLHPTALSGLPVEVVLEVGGRLLVVVCAAVAWREVEHVLSALLAAGRRMREVAGFNRLRIVVPTPDPARAEPALLARFTELAGGDEHVFLHVVEPSRVPISLLPLSDG